MFPLQNLAHKGLRIGVKLAKPQQNKTESGLCAYFNIPILCDLHQIPSVLFILLFYSQ